MKVHHTEKYLLNPEHPITVHVIGCGGNGSQMIMQLARINEALKKLGHIGIHVTCFDNDIITEANLGRQLFSASELGMNKAVAMITRVNRFYNNSWTAMPILYSDRLHMNDCSANITISCVDSIEARKQINHIVIRDNKANDPLLKRFYWMDLGNTQNTGQFIISTLQKIVQPAKNKNAMPYMSTIFEKFPALYKQKEKVSGPSCSLAEALNKQDLFVNSILVQFAAQMIWQLFHEGKINHQGAFINLQTLKIATINL